VVEAIVGAALRAILASVVLGGVLAALVVLATRTLALTAATRHALWTTALLATGIMPLAGVGVSLWKAAPAQPVTAVVVDRSHPALAPSAPPTHSARASHSAPVPPRTAAIAAPDALALVAWTPRMSRTLALGAVLVWAAGALIGLFGLAASVVRVRGLKRRSSPLDGDLADELPWLTEQRTGREIYLRLSYETETPVAIGFRRPVILIPTELATADGLDAIEPLVMHEYAHLRRYDDWTNLVQRVIERVLWFNPVVWLVGRRIALEREIASDDAVVERTGAAHAYATSLWRLAREMRMPEHAVVAPGALLTRKQITVRIEQLLDTRRSRLHRSPGTALAVAAAGALAVALVATSAPAVELPPAAAAPIVAHTAPASPAPAVWTAVAKHATVQHAAVQHPNRVAIEAHTAPVHPVAIATIKVITRVEHRIVYEVVQPRHSPAAAAAAGAGAAASTTSSTVTNAGTTARTTTVARSDPPRPPLPPEALQGLKTAASVGPIVSAALRDALAGIPREIAQESGRSSARGRFDGTRVPREVIAACTGCSFRNADLHGIDLHGLKLTGDSFNGADLRGANLAGVHLSGVSLRSANLAGADLRGAQLSGVEMQGANFDGAQLDGMRLSGVSLRGTTFRGTALRSVLGNCVGCDLNGMDLHGQDLHGIALSGADLSHADLHDANLSGVQFSGVDLSHANLAGADLTNARLTGCDLIGIELRGARTTGMTMSGSDVN
jgi:uncharacterized protein YjbI with pentapeptide repeats/beta-lactamase regulating signal transducer with metallopeptidase domain